MISRATPSPKTCTQLIRASAGRSGAIFTEANDYICRRWDLDEEATLRPEVARKLDHLRFWEVNERGQVAI